MAETGTIDGVHLERLPTAGGGDLGIATLDDPGRLNALNLAMVRRLDAALKDWLADPTIAVILLRGAGDKAFCAGGDVRGLRDAILAHDAPDPNPAAEAFFSEEYRLDHRIHTSDKPIVVWGSGIVMGGGLGLLAGARHRVVTETSRIAMPEVAIGLFPDVGGSWFLRRMPGRCGLFLGLTGVSMGGADACFTGLADHLLRAEDATAVVQALRAITWPAAMAARHDRVHTLLSGFARPDTAPSAVAAHADTIAALTAGDDLAALHARITGYDGDDPWLQRAATGLAAGSPTSVALVWALWQRCRHMSLAEVFRTELIVALQCCAHPDFPEGVRALLVDRDRQPQWSPAQLSAVSDALIDAHFAAPWCAWQNQSHPLANLGLIP